MKAALKIAMKGCMDKLWGRQKPSSLFSPESHILHTMQ